MLPRSTMPLAAPNDLIRLRHDAEQARLRYEYHLEQYQTLVDATVEQVRDCSNTWTLSQHQAACPDPALAEQLENEHNYMRDRFLETVQKLREAELSTPTEV